VRARPRATQKADRPTLWIIAGPNGSGKSTLYSTTNIEDFGQSVWIINPDLLAEQISVGEQRALVDANLEAVRRIEQLLTASIAAYQTVGVETVLSTSKYRKLVVEAKKKGFEIRLIYVVLDDVEKNVERVRQRVDKGGHDVPEDRIRVRYNRSLNQLPWFLNHADKAFLYDNSNIQPRLMAKKEHDVITIYPATFSKIRKILVRMSVGGRRGRLAYRRKLADG